MAADPRSHWPIRIGSRRYVLETAAAGFGPISIVRQHSLDNEEANERSFHNPGIWRRYRDTWVQGAGQEWLDDGDRQNPKMFMDSRHCEVGMQRSIRLTKNIESQGVFTSTEKQFLVVGGFPQQLYWLYDNTCQRKPSPTSPDWNASAIGGAGPVTSAVFVNNRIITAHGEGNFPREMDPAGSDSWSRFGNDNSVTPEFLSYCGGRLVGGNGPNLYELDVDGTRQGNADIMTHLNTSFNWMGAASAPIGIYYWGDNEVQGEIWYSTISETDGSLTHPIMVAQMPVGEWVTSLVFYGSLVVIGTNHGVRLGIASTTGGLQFGKLAVTTDYPIWDLTVWGQYLWAPLVALRDEGVFTEDPANEVGLAKFDLATFRDGEELVPAWWADLTVETQGNTLVCEAVETYGDRRWFTVRDANQCAVYAESVDEYRSGSGALKTGKITFGTPEHKRFIRLKMSWDPLPLGARIRAAIRKDTGDTWQAIIDDSSEGSRGAIANIDPDLIGPHAELVFILDRSSSRTETPVIRSWFLEAIPLPFKTREFVLPLQISEGVQPAFGSSKGYLDPFEEVQYLMNLEDTREIVDFELGGLRYKAIVDEVRVDQTREVTRTHRWSENQEVLTGAVYVRMTTVEGFAEGSDVGLE